MRSPCCGCLGSSRAAVQQHCIGPSTALVFCSFLKVLFTATLLRGSNVNGCHHSPANFAPAAEAPGSSSSVDGFPLYSNPINTFSIVSTSNSSKSGGTQLGPSSGLRAAHSILAPIRLHLPPATVPGFEDHKYANKTGINSEDDATQEQKAPSAQDGDQGNSHLNSNLAEALGTADSSFAENDAGRAVPVMPNGTAPVASTAGSEQSFGASLALAHDATSTSRTLQEVRTSCKDCEGKTAAMERKRRSMTTHDGLHDDQILSTSSASFAATGDLRDTKADKQIDRQDQDMPAALPHAVGLPDTLADEGISRLQTQHDEQPQEGPEDDNYDDDADDAVNTHELMPVTGVPQEEPQGDNSDAAGVLESVRTQNPSNRTQAPSAGIGDSDSTDVRASVAGARASRVRRRSPPRRLRMGRRSTVPPAYDPSQSSVQTITTTTDGNPSPLPPSRFGAPDGSDATFAPPAGSWKSLSENPAMNSAQNMLGSNNSPRRWTPPGEPLTWHGTPSFDAGSAVTSMQENPTWQAHDEGHTPTGNAEADGGLNTDFFSGNNTDSVGKDSNSWGASPFSQTSRAPAGLNSEDGVLGRPTGPNNLLTGKLKSNLKQATKSSNNTVASTRESDAPTGLRPITGAPEVDTAFKMKVSPESAKILQEHREKRRQEQAQRTPTDLETIYKKASSAVPAANYLGVGYDSVKGNPVGDPVIMGDPGLRAPVIRLEYKQDADGVSNDLTSLQPVGGFVRPYVACRQSESIKEINSLHDYQKELSVDASLQGGDLLGANCFSASAGYKEVAKEVTSKVNKSYMIRTYCIRYEAGLAQSSNMKWTPTLAFSAAVDQLPTDFDGKKPGCACTPDQWRQDHTVEACRSSNIPLWFSFFDQFGTHYITRLFAGGKMTYQVTVNASDVRKAKMRGVNVEAQIKLQLGVFSGGGSNKVKNKSQSKSQNYELNITKETLIIGGRPPADVSDPASLASWADTVEELPMPVKMEVQSLQYQLPPEKQQAFSDAIAFYAKAVGMSLQDLNLLNGEVKTLPQLLKEATQVAWAGPAPGFARCPPGKVVIAGFAAHLSFLEKHLTNYHISACSPGREKCDGVGASSTEHDDERIYMVCGDESINELQQVVAESPPGTNETGTILEASCPDDTVVVGGFGFSVGADRAGLEAFDIEACITGQTICTKAPSPHSTKSYIWLICVDKQYPGARNLRNAVALGAVGKADKNAYDNDGEVTVKCPENSKIVQGFVMEAHTSFQQVRDRYSHCKAGIDQCTMFGKGIENGGLLKHDRHALFGWCLCSTGVEPSAHVASDSRRKARIRLQSIMKKNQATTSDALVADTDVHPQEPSREPLGGRRHPRGRQRARRKRVSGTTSAADGDSVHPAAQLPDSSDLVSSQETAENPQASGDAVETSRTAL